MKRQAPRRAQGRKRRGFTLIEILVVIVIIGVLATMGVSKYTEFTTDSRRNACISNQSGVDKGVGVWESRWVAITRTVRVTIGFRGDGSVGAGPPTGTLPPLAAPNGLQVGSRSIADMVKDDNVFMCPEVASQAGGYSAVSRTSNIYLWVSDPGAQSYLNNNRRGVCCVNFSYSGSADQNGPDGTVNTRHR